MFKKTIALTLTVLILFLTSGVSFSSNLSSETTEILIGLKDGFGPDALVNINVDAKTVDYLPEINTIVMSVSYINYEHLNKIKSAFKRANGVLFVEDNYIISAATVALPNDPLLPAQWNLNSVKVPEAWGLMVSNPVEVAVIDSGIDFNHSDLVDRTIDGIDYVYNDNNPQDDYGHGTQISGVIAAVSDNGIGISGILSNVRIMPVKVLNNNGKGTYLNVAKGLIWAADHGAKVINLSLTGSEKSSALKKAVKYTAQKGIIIVSAAGNNGYSLPVYPASYKEVIAVGAIDESDQKAEFSNYGDYLDVVAPGVDVISTYLDNQYINVTGTSIAAPHISALAAALLAKGYTSEQVKQIILKSCDDLGNTGFDPYYGYGKVNFYKALNL